MTQNELVRSAGRAAAFGVGAAAATYAAYVGTTWLRYGNARPAVGHERDSLLDSIMPTYEVAERHRVFVHAPADVTFAVSCGIDLDRSAIVRAIFKGRELVLGGRSQTESQPTGLLAAMTGAGWGVLTEVPNREIVMGSVTRPWDADVSFRTIAPEAFARFDEPGYVKIVWTLRADPIGAHDSVARTETRVATTDPIARAKFRRYWSIFSPGIVVIRIAALKLVKAEAERRANELRTRNLEFGMRTQDS